MLAPAMMAAANLGRSGASLPFRASVAQRIACGRPWPEPCATRCLVFAVPSRSRYLKPPPPCPPAGGPSPPSPRRNASESSRMSLPSRTRGCGRPGLVCAGLAGSGNPACFTQRRRSSCNRLVLHLWPCHHSTSSMEAQPCRWYRRRVPPRAWESVYCLFENSRRCDSSGWPIRPKS